MNRYENYLETGYEWIGKIPSSWELSRVGKYFTERSEKVDDVTYPPLSVTMNGIVDQLSDVAKSNDNDNRKLVKKDDFVINSRSDRKGSSGIAPRDGSVSLINIVLAPKNIDPKYIENLFKSYYFKEEYFRNGKGIHWDLWTTRWEQFKNISIPIPPIEEQKLISRYLDKKTNQIDSLVENIQKKIELLKEQRTSLINHYVTKGLDPNVEIKDSGVEWIGEIPKHWGVTRLKHISQVSLSSVDRHEHDDELKVNICHYPDVYKNEYITTQTDLPSGTCSESEFLKFALRDGDVLLTKDSESPDDIGIPTFVRGSLENTVCGYHLGVIRSSSGKIHSNYLYRFIESKSAKDYFFTKSSGITRFGLGKGSIENLTIPLPPQDEQIKIAKKIDYTSDKLSKISENLLIKIYLLKEYRQSLISSVVTGKVRVTEDMI